MLGKSDPRVAYDGLCGGGKGPSCHDRFGPWRKPRPV